MHAIEHLADHAWTRPRHYSGFSPDGDYCIVTQNRDSGTLERSNFTTAGAQLRQLADAETTQPAETRDDYGQISERSAGWVYSFVASHFLCGWVEYLLVRADAPEAVLTAAGEIVCSLADYPVLDETHFCELEYSEACAAWSSESVRGRFDALKRSGSRGVSMFAARREELPQDDTGALVCYLLGN